MKDKKKGKTDKHSILFLFLGQTWSIRVKLGNVEDDEIAYAKIKRTSVGFC